MPNYPGTPNSTVLNTTPPLPVALYPGDTVVLFNAEQPAVPQASIAVALSQSSPEGVVPSLAIEGFFSGAPGAFEIDLQTADTDADAFYQSNATTIAAVNAATQAFRQEYANIRAKFARILLKSRANAVNLTARLSR